MHVAPGFARWPPVFATEAAANTALPTVVDEKGATWLTPEQLVSQRGLDVSGHPSVHLPPSTEDGNNTRLEPHSCRAEFRPQAADGEALLESWWPKGTTTEHSTFVRCRDTA